MLDHRSYTDDWWSVSREEIMRHHKLNLPRHDEDVVGYQGSGVGVAWWARLSGSHRSAVQAQ